MWTIFNSSALKDIINVFLLYHSFKLTWSATSRGLVGDQLHQVAKRSPRDRRPVGNQSPISRRPTAKPSCDSSALALNFGRGEVAERLQCMSDWGLRVTDEGSVPEMHIWSILLTKSDLKWCIHLSRSLFLCFNYLVRVTAGGLKSPRGHIAKFCGRARLIRSILRASKCSVLKLIEMVILRVYYTISFGFSLFRHFWASRFNLLKYFVWLRITDESSIPEMHIWSILLIKSDLKWCIDLSRSLFLCFNYLVRVTAGGLEVRFGYCFFAVSATMAI